MLMRTAMLVAFGLSVGLSALARAEELPRYMMVRCI
jgi:hypothetical protein